MAGHGSCPRQLLQRLGMDAKQCGSTLGVEERLELGRFKSWCHWLSLSRKRSLLQLLEQFALDDPKPAFFHEVEIRRHPNFAKR